MWRPPQSKVLACAYSRKGNAWCEVWLATGWTQVSERSFFAARLMLFVALAGPTCCTRRLSMAAASRLRAMRERHNTTMNAKMNLASTCSQAVRSMDTSTFIIPPNMTHNRQITRAPSPKRPQNAQIRLLARAAPRWPPRTTFVAIYHTCWPTKAWVD